MSHLNLTVQNTERATALSKCKNNKKYINGKSKLICISMQRGWVGLAPCWVGLGRRFVVDRYDWLPAWKLLFSCDCEVRPPAFAGVARKEILDRDTKMARESHWSQIGQNWERNENFTKWKKTNSFSQSWNGVIEISVFFTVWCKIRAHKKMQLSFRDYCNFCC